MPPYPLHDVQPVELLVDYCLFDEDTAELGNKLVERTDDDDEIMSVCKTVCFARECDVIDTIHRNDMTQEEISAYWHNRAEYETMKTQLLGIISAMNAGYTVRGEHITSRGLEGLTENGHKRKFMHRKIAVNEVLAEQERQLLYNYSNAERISEVYLGHSSISSSAAIIMARKDEQDVKQGLIQC